MTQVSTLRRNLLRLGYLILVVGLGLTIWPGILNPARTWPLMNGVVFCMLGALSLLSVIGLFHPLKMLPLLLFEVAWKVIWLARVALPLWSTGRLDADTAETAGECVLIVAYLFLVPWRYVGTTFLFGTVEPWRRSSRPVSAPSNLAV